MSTKSIMDLLARRDALLQELGEVNAKIIGLTLDTSAANRPAVAGRAAADTRRKWFERGEMLRLTRKVLTEPRSQADLVRALASAKGYDKSLPAGELARFKSAAYQAIAAALGAKQLVRNKQGQVAAPRR